MKNSHALENPFTRHLRRIAGAMALALAFMVAPLPPAHTATPVPNNIRVPAGHGAFLDGHAVGTQNYICLPSGWTFFGPQATLFDAADEQIITHFLSPNPFEIDTARATWQHSGDTSTIWAMAIESSSNPGFVAPGAIPWLLLQVVGAQGDPTDRETLTATTYIQRLNTSGGIAPSTGCAQPADVGKRAFVLYEADYVFYNAE